MSESKAVQRPSLSQKVELIWSRVISFHEYTKHDGSIRIPIVYANETRSEITGITSLLRDLSNIVYEYLPTHYETPACIITVSVRQREHIAALNYAKRISEGIYLPLGVLGDGLKLYVPPGRTSSPG